MAGEILTLAELERWSFDGTALAVLGHPIGHSISPEMHNAALAQLAKTDAQWRGWKYFRIEVPPPELPRALDLLHARRFRGVNLTVPHKVMACELVDEIDEAARPAGAVNTLLWNSWGWRGFNTDGYGLSAALRETLGRELAGADVLLLGAGGAARGAAVECLQRRCASLAVANRGHARRDELLYLLRGLADGIPVKALELPPAAIPAGALVINATSAGLKPEDPSPLDLASVARPAGIYDMIYNPPQTPLLRQAAQLGVRGANGLSMLVHQGAKALEIWTGVAAERTAPMMRAAAQAALAGRS
ncbi:MAG TPA: shikimate dehydrogenase [Opitutaceae bacterium]|nr:shikimate dehydrogenase [Opitutaceae bacterium]